MVAVVFFIAALAQIAGYLETSTKWPKVVAMLSSIASPETFTFVYRLLFLLGAAFGLWWINRRLRKVEAEAQVTRERIEEVVDKTIDAIDKTNGIIEERLRRLESEEGDPYVSLRPDEIIHPSDNGVLWKWDAGKGADGPFCPRHRDRLFHKNWLDHVKTEDFEEGHLDSYFWFSCPTDQENFKFPEIRMIKVKEVRAQAAARLRDK